ncbi:uncharacterized protein [Atheta coriaria]|uniref:uncharacterized protein n=1 Tax=Dalotia coriaria TaxID=877792 RepID=UPI0031F43062
MSNPTLNVVLKLKPSNANCLGFNSWRPKWIVQGSQKIPADKLEIINENKRMIIPKNSMKYSDSVAVVATVKDNFESWFRIKTIPKIVKPDCKITPSSGISLKTKFLVSCTAKDQHLDTFGPYYTVYQIVNGKNNLVVSTADQHFQVLLSSIKGQPSQTLVIEGRDIFHNSFECNVNPITIRKADLSKKKIEEDLKTLNELSKEGNPIGPQYAAALLNEVNQQAVGKDIEKMVKANIMKSMNEVDIQAMSTYEQISSITSRFVDVGQVDTKYKENLANLCKRMGSIHLKELHKNVYAKYEETTAKAQAQLNADCGEKLLEETIEEEKVETTTMPDVEPVIKEDYPDYEMPFGNPAIDAIKTSGLDIITESSKAIATTLSGGEQYLQTTNTTQSLIAVEEGKYMASKPMEIGTISVLPSKQFKDEGENLITAIISNYDKDMLTPSSDLSSNIVEVNFFKDSKKMSGTSYNIQFPILNESVPYDSYKVKAPKADDEFLQIDRKMNVHRLSLYALETCLIRFKIEKHVKLRVALSVNQRPRNHHFTNKPSKFTVDGSKTSSWTIENPYPRSETDTLFYVAVIPHTDMLHDNPADMIPYEVQFTQIACVTYSRSKHKWVPTAGCNVKVTGGDNDSLVHCICSTTSLHSVFFKPIPNRLEIQMDIEYVIADFVNYIIFIHVIVVLIAYAIALALSIKRQPKIFGRDKIFFLSDNLKNDRFCYMLVVRTGSLASAGTTSNIMAQITGTKGKSKPHVLNYPDPGCLLLQRDSIDWMILTNATHLGDLESILLWTDGIGLYPEWFCQDITIFDLQKQTPYQFKVNTWISPLEKHSYYIRVNVTPDTGEKTKEKVNLVKHLRFHYLGRHTWNIFVKDDEELTYPERLTVILSMIYTTYTVVIWLLRPPSLSRADSFGYGSLRVYTEIFCFVLASSVISSAIHLTIVYFLRNSKRSELSVALVVAIKRFPFKTRKVIRYTLIGWIIFCLAYLIIFGFWMPYKSAYLWIIITFLSILMSIIVWENVFIIAVDIITSHVGYVEKLVYRFDAIVIEIERQRKVLFKKFGEVLMRPYFRKHYRLLTPNELFNLRQTIKTRLEVASLFKDMCLFLLFIAILYLICIVQYDSVIHRSNRMMHRMVEESIYSDRTHLLDNIEKIEDVYDYLEHVIIPLIHPTKWYGKWYASDAGLLADFATRILGVVQLRQQRRQQKCTVPDPLQVLQIPCTNDAPIFDKWDHYNGSDITSTIGHYKMYDGSGYIAYLGRTLKNSKFILEILREHKWIDINTAVLFIDFLTYNANLNMFNGVRIIIERSPSGRYRKSSQIFTTSLIYTDIFLELLTAFLLILLTIVIVIMLLKRLVQILVFKGKYFNNFWNLLDVTLSILSVLLITLFFMRRQYTADLLKTIVETDHNRFVNYYHLITLSEATTIIYGITLSLATLRLWKFLHFGVLFRIMERAILQAGPHLLGMFLYQIIVYLMMVSFIYPIFGENMHEFRDYYSALVTLYLASINFTEHLPNLYTSMNTSLLYLIYSFYLVLSVCFLNLYATTLIISLEESRIYYSNGTHLYSIHTYVLDVFYFYKEKLRRHLEGTRLKGGASWENFQVDVDRLVYPKGEEHRYADIISMNKRKMNLMRTIAIVAIKNMTKYGRQNKEPTEQDLYLMAQIVVNLIKTQDDQKEKFAHIFFKGFDPTTGKCTFVPDTKLLQMEMIVKKLLEGKVEEIKIEQDLLDLVIHQSGDGARLTYINKCLELINRTINHIIVVEDKRKIREIQSISKTKPELKDELYEDDNDDVVATKEATTQSEQK